MKKVILACVLSVLSITFVYAESTSIEQVAEAVASNITVPLLASNPTYGGGKAYVTFVTKDLRYTVWSNPDRSIFSVWVRKNGTFGQNKITTFSFSGEMKYVANDFQYGPYPQSCEFALISKGVSVTGKKLIYSKGDIGNTADFTSKDASMLCDKHLVNIADYYSV